MSYTAATTAELEKFYRRVDLKLELRTGFSASNQWLQYPWSSLNLRLRRTGTGSLSATLPSEQTRTFAITAADTGNAEFTLAGDQTQRFRQYVSFSVSGSTGNDDDYMVASDAYLRSGQTVVPVASVADGTADGTVTLYSLFAGEQTKVQRCQLAGEVRLTAQVLTDSGLETRRMLTGRIWQKNGGRGSVSLEIEDWGCLLNDCVCEVETIPTALSIVSDSTYRALAQLDAGALAADGIYGLTANGHGTLAITGGNQGAQQFTVAGDQTAYLGAGVTFNVIGSTGNDGIYTVASSSFGAGTTTVTVDEAIPSATLDGSLTDGGFDESTNTLRRPWHPLNTRVYWLDGAEYVQLGDDKYSIDWASGAVQILEEETRDYFISQLSCSLESGATGATDCDLSVSIQAALEYAMASGGIEATAGELDISSTGFDHPVPYYFRGNVKDLIDDLQGRLHAGIRLRWRSDLGTNGKWKLETVTQNTPASPDYTALHVIDCEQTLSLRDLFTSVEMEGDKAQTTNLLANATIYEIAADASRAWFPWDGFKVETDGTFSSVSPNLHDGILSLGASLHGLDASVSPGTDYYDSWYPFVAYDLGELKRPDDGLEVWMPLSRHPDAGNIDNKDGTWLWPGIWVEVSEDSTDGLDGNWYTLAAAVDRVRYKPGEKVRVDSEQFLRHRFSWIRFSCGAYKHGYENLLDPSVGLAEVRLLDESRYRIVKSIDQAASPVTEYEYTSGATFSRNHPDLGTRFGGRFRTHGPLDMGSQFPEGLAHDVAIKQLDEDLRVYSSVNATVVVDPRLDVDDTVAIPDQLNGSIEVLAEEVGLTARAPAGKKPGSLTTTLQGANYQEEALANS